MVGSCDDKRWASPLADLNKFAGSWTGLGPDDVLLLPRDISTQEIYALDMERP
jgi:hypothetical protein